MMIPEIFTLYSIIKLITHFQTLKSYFFINKPSACHKFFLLHFIVHHLYLEGLNFIFGKSASILYSSVYNACYHE